MTDDVKSDHTYLLAFIASEHDSFEDWDDNFEMNAVISPNNKDDTDTKHYFLTLIRLLQHCTHLLNEDDDFRDFVHDDLIASEKIERGNNVINLFTPTKGSA
jgi:hypothetical protein|tara:strand:+ start:242 stop:547 length:306 start_codon:yes stop_codon:yes gene_type:complete